MLVSALILCGALLAGYVLLMLAIRLRCRRPPVVKDAQDNFDWTVDELHRLRDAGQMSDAEFNRAREVILANVRLRGARDDDGPQKGFDVLPPKPD